MSEETYTQIKGRKTRYSKLLRRQMTKAEALLWNQLRRKGLKGLKFRRQVPIGAYIVDFLCFEKRLVIEVDGGIHEKQKEYDLAREQVLERSGLKILRFTNEEVFSDMNSVLKKIIETIS